MDFFLYDTIILVGLVRRWVADANLTDYWSGEWDGHVGLAVSTIQLCQLVSTATNVSFFRVQMKEHEDRHFKERIGNIDLRHKDGMMNDHQIIKIKYSNR